MVSPRRSEARPHQSQKRGATGTPPRAPTGLSARLPACQHYTTVLCERYSEDSQAVRRRHGDVKFDFYHIHSTSQARRAFFLEGQDVFNTSPRTQVAAAPAALSRCSIRAGSVAQRYTIFPMTLTLSPPIAVSPRSYSVRRSSQGKPETGATGRWSLARMTRRFAAPLTMVRR